MFSHHQSIHISQIGVLACIILSSSPIWSEEIDEAAMFSDTSSIVDSAKVVNTKEIKAESADKKSVGFSGGITSAMTGNVTREGFRKPGFAQTSLWSQIVGNLMLDVRLLNSVKAFANTEAQYAPDSNKASFFLREIFIDANINKKVYFRTGKQVLQWGPCYFWNPTDLVNVEKKSFIPKLGYREGTYGLKMHVPFGTVANIYGFVDTRNTPQVDSLAGALKGEFLAGGTEMAFGIWGKRGHKPVYGFDISTQLLKVNLSAELGLYQKMTIPTIPLVNGKPGSVTKEWVPRACVNVNRSFGVLGVQDRLSLVGEFYYNQVGVTDAHVPTIADLLGTAPPPGMPVPSVQEMADTLIANGLYEPNNYSKFYVAFFGSMGKFILSDMTLTLNAIGNLNQGCAAITAGTSYVGLNDFSLGLSVTGYVGPENTEYTFYGNAMQAQLTAAVTF